MIAEEIKFRAHYYGDIMTGVAKGWDIDKSVTCKRRLVKIYREMMFDKRKGLSNKYIEKGLATEEDAITLYSRYTKRFLKKNSERLSNDIYQGEVDLYIGEQLLGCEETIDTKCSWDLDTFPTFFDKPDDDYVYQGLVYLDLTGAKRHTVVHALNNTPADLIMDEKRKLAWKMSIIDEETEAYKNACMEIEKNSIHDLPGFLKHYPHFDFHIDINNWKWDIPMKHRIHESVIERDEEKLKQMRLRGFAARKWMEENLFKS